MEFVARLRSPLPVLSFFLIIALGFYHDSVIRFASLWVSDDYSHGFLLLAVCIYIFYERWRDRTTAMVLKPSFPVVLLIIGMSFIWAAASLTFIEKIELIGFLLILPLLMVSLFGWQQAKGYLFPFLLLLLAAPVVEVFNNSFRLATAILSSLALDITGLTVFSEGYIIQLPVGTFEVDTGCSGIRVVTVGLILSFLMVYLNKLNPKQSAILVSLGFLFAFLSNIIRVYIIIIAGHLTNMQHPLIKDHDNLGWIVFGVMMLLYYITLHRFFPALIKKGSGSASEPQTASSTNQLTTVIQTPVLLAGMVAIFIGLASGPLLIWSVTGKGASDQADNFHLPATLGTLSKNSELKVDWSPEYKFGKGSFVEQAIYSDGQNRVNLVIRHFSTQSAENEAINVNNRVYPRGNWSEVSSRLLTGYNNRVLPFPVEETVINKGARQMLVWRWYLTDGKKTGDAKWAKLNNLWGTLKTTPGITVFIISTTKDSQIENSRAILAGTLFSLETTEIPWP